MDAAAIERAEASLATLFDELASYPSVSAWCGPDFEYDQAFHELLEVPDLGATRARQLRHRGLVAMLLTALGAIEEHYGLGRAGNRAECIACLERVTPEDDDEARLLSIVRAAFVAIPRKLELDTIETLAIARDAQWVYDRYVRAG